MTRYRVKKLPLVVLVALSLSFALTVGTANAVNLLGYYEFEGTYNNSSGPIGAAFPAQNPAQVNIVPGGFRGAAVDINDPAASGGGNSGGSLNVPYNANPNESPQVSFGGWFNLQTNAGFPGAVAIDNGGWDRGIMLAGNNWGIASGGNTNNIAAAPTNAWTYVVGTFDKNANQAILYVGNDNAATQTTSSGGRPDGGNNPGEVQIEIGRYDNQDLDSLVDDFVVWDAALTPHQANAVRNLRTSTLDYSPLLAEQLFDLFDLGSGNSALIGGVTWEYTTGLNPTNPGEVFSNSAVVLDTMGNGLQIASAVPEPSTFAIGLLALAGIGGLTWRRRRR